MTDTRNLLASWSEADEQDYRAAIFAAEEAAKPGVHAVHAKWVEERVVEMVAKGADEKEARSQMAMLRNGSTMDLPPAYVVHFANGESPTVAEVLANPDRYDGKACADPVEGPEYGKTTAKFWKNGEDGKPCFNSFAHGTMTRYFPKPYEIEKDKLPFDVNRLKAGKKKPEQQAAPLPAKPMQEQQGFLSAPFPVDALNDLAALIQANSMVSHPEAAKAAALSVASLLCGRRYFGPDGIPSHLHVTLAASSVSLIRPIGEGVAGVIDRMGRASMLRRTRPTAPAALYHTLFSSYSTLYLSSDYGHMVSYAPRQPSGLLTQVLDAIAELYCADVLQLTTPEEAGFTRQDATEQQTDRPRLDKPALGLLALVSHAELASMAKASEIGRGRHESMSIILLDDYKFTSREPVLREIPLPLLALAQRVRPYQPTLDRAMNVEMPPQDTVVCKADGSFKQCDGRLLALPGEDMKMLSAVHGARERARRITQVLAGFDNPEHPVLAQHLINWASDYTYGHTKAFLEKYDLVSSEDGRASNYQKLLDYIVKKGPSGVLHRKLHTNLDWYRSLDLRKRGDLLTALEDDGEITEVNLNGTKIWKATRFGGSK